MPRLIAGFAALLLAGCGSQEPYRIAVVGGSGLPVAAELAVQDVNAAGGIAGRTLELAIVDEPRDVQPRDAIAAAERLAADPSILAVIGHGGSGTSLAASQVYNARGVPQVAPTSSAPLFAQAGPWSFRLVASDEHQARFMARLVADMDSVRRVAVLYVNDDYGRALHAFLHPALRNANVDLVLESPFVKGPEFAASLDATIAAVKHARPDLLIWVGLIDELQVLRPRLRAELPALRVFGSDGVSFIGAFADLAPFEGDWVVSYTDVNADRQPLRRVAARFEPMSGRALTDGAALMYDAVGIVADAMRAGARDREAIRNHLETYARGKRTYAGVTGDIAFDANGDARPAYVLLEITRRGARSIVR
jgi:branched-chain amino acid transport system substrate-binding protein